MIIKKSAISGLMMIAFLFCGNAAYAQIPIPTIGAELATQIDQLTKHIDELKKVKDQITNGIEQAKAMGDKLSMDALKNFASGALKSALSGGIQGLAMPQEMQKVGFSDDVLKDPEKITDKLESIKRKPGEKLDIEKRDACLQAQGKMQSQLSMSGLANSFALQKSISDGEDMKKAQEASSSSDDQMQLIGANTATLKVMYQQQASSTMMDANRLASMSIGGMCD